MATNVNISVPTFTDGEGNLLTLDKAIRAAIRASLQSKERTPKIEKGARSQASGAKESGNIKIEPRRDPGAVKKKKQQPLTAGSAASNAGEDQQDGGGSGPIFFPYTAATITYSWSTGADLDTVTRITSPYVSGYVGWAHGGSSTNITWGGDNTSSVGSETITVNLYSIWNANKSATSVTVALAANWYGQQGNSVTISVQVTRAGSPTITRTHTKSVTLVQQGGFGQSIGAVTIELFSGSISNT